MIDRIIKTWTTNDRPSSGFVGQPDLGTARIGRVAAYALKSAYLHSNGDSSRVRQMLEAGLELADRSMTSPPLIAQIRPTLRSPTRRPCSLRRRNRFEEWSGYPVQPSWRLQNPHRHLTGTSRVHNGAAGAGKNGDDGRKPDAPTASRLRVRKKRLAEPMEGNTRPAPRPLLRTFRLAPPPPPPPPA